MDNRVEQIALTRMAAGPHLAFGTAMVKKLGTLGPQTLNIEKEYGVLETCVERETAAYNQQRKSEVVQHKGKADEGRDSNTIALGYLVEAGLHSSDEAIRTAAERVQAELEAANRPKALVRQAYEVQTVGTAKLIKVLREKYPNEVQVLGLAPVLSQIEGFNNTCAELSEQRVDEIAGKLDYTFGEAKQATNEAIANIRLLINADIVRKGDDSYAVAVAAINALIQEHAVRGSAAQAPQAPQAPKGENPPALS